MNREKRKALEAEICHWASQLGRPLTPEQGLLMWEWDKRWKEVTGG